MTSNFPGATSAPLCRSARFQSCPFHPIRHQAVLVIGCAVGLQDDAGFLAAGHALYRRSKTGSTAWRNSCRQSSAPRWAVVEQLAYIQSMPFSATRRIRLWVSSSTVSLKASDGEWPWLRSVLILGFHDACQGAHQNAALAGQVTVDFMLECGWEEVSRANGDAERQGAFAGTPGIILFDSKGRLIPEPFRKFRRTLRPEPLGATRMTST